MKVDEPRYPSLALAEAARELAGKPAAWILDCGAPSRATRARAQSLNVQLRFESLTDLARFDDASHGEWLTAMLDAFPAGSQFDLILAWDLFNYLSLPTITWLCELLAPSLAPGAQLYIVRYNGSRIPSQAQAFHWDALDQVAAQPRGPWVNRREPSHTTTDLLRAMSGFQLQTTYMQKAGMFSGMSEHLLRFGSARAPARLGGTQTSPTQGPGPVAEHRCYGLAEILPKAKTLLDLGSAGNRLAVSGLRLLRDDIAARFAPGYPLKLNIKPQPCDAVLLWDSLNFLSGEALSQLFAQLRPFLAPGQPVHALLYMGRERPGLPQNFSCEDGSHLHFRPNLKRPHTPLTTAALTRAADGFVIEQVFSFKPGMYPGMAEYLLRAV